MKSIIILSLLLFCSCLCARGLDYRLFQYPVEDAKKSASSVYPVFMAYIVGENKENRIPGVEATHIDIIKKKYRVKIMNEFRLYDHSEMGIDEKILLERYCTRYNRQLVNSLGL
ncbi:hypothetical protein NBRC116188_07620 [Oceaniserpentilla sp. 4NH20-0058]|uniref:hypothetical protein n=1 Tax=Oceaniserpentilla sp. 4NH20-0058 TaxID=3127660 RepID=UPI0031087876